MRTARPYLIAAAAVCATLLAASCDSPAGSSGREVVSVVIEPDPAVVTVGEALQLQATLLDAASDPVTGIDPFWSSEDTLIAAVSAGGEVLGRAAGTVRVAASAAGTSTVATVVVEPKRAASVVVSPRDTTIRSGQKVTLVATPRAASGEPLPDRPVTWRSLSPDIASVNEQGEVTGRAPGSAQISATSDAATGTASVTVTRQPVHTVQVNPRNLQLDVGEERTLQVVLRGDDGTVLTGREVEWASHDTRVATVASDGRVTAMAAGVATIRATSEGRSGSAEVAVRSQPVSRIELEPESLRLAPRQSARIEARLTAADGTVLTGRVIAWESDDESVATVDDEGNVRGVFWGNATIVARSEGRSASAQVQVRGWPTSELLLPDQTQLAGNSDAR